MKCTIDSKSMKGISSPKTQNFKFSHKFLKILLSVFYRALQFLAKIGDEIHFESFVTGLTLSTVNYRKTAYGRIKFETEFFMEYEDDVGKEDETQCKVSIKCILPLFRAMKQVNDLTYKKF